MTTKKDDTTEVNGVVRVHLFKYFSIWVVLFAFFVVKDKDVFVTMLRTAFLIHCILALSVAQPEADPQSENIDTLQPIMRSSPEMGQFDDDLFGYTVVLHKTRSGGGIDDTL